MYQTSVNVIGYESSIIELPIDAEFLICDVEFNGVKDRCYFKNGTLPLKETNAITVIDKTDNSITLRANDYLHSVYLEGDYVFSNNYFSMLNGEEITLTYRKASINKNSTLFTLNAYTLSK